MAALMPARELDRAKFARLAVEIDRGRDVVMPHVQLAVRGIGKHPLHRLVKEPRGTRCRSRRESVTTCLLGGQPRTDRGGLRQLSAGSSAGFDRSGSALRTSGIWNTRLMSGSYTDGRLNATLDEARTNSSTQVHSPTARCR